MRVILRALNISDSEKIYPWLLDSEVQSLTGGNKYFASIDYVRKWAEDKIFNSKDLYLAICLSDSKEIIGYLSINDIDHRNRKAVWGGILIGEKEYWGKGIATEAAQLMLTFVFKELNVNLLWGWVHEEHSASIRMLEKLGFRKIGILPQSIYKGGKYSSLIMVCILKDEYSLHEG